MLVACVHVGLLQDNHIKWCLKTNTARNTPLISSFSVYENTSILFNKKRKGRQTQELNISDNKQWWKFVKTVTGSNKTSAIPLSDMMVNKASEKAQLLNNMFAANS